VHLGVEGVLDDVALALLDDRLERLRLTGELGVERAERLLARPVAQHGHRPCSRAS
jgi:hypothetical protein